MKNPYVFVFLWLTTTFLSHSKLNVEMDDTSKSFSNNIISVNQVLHNYKNIHPCLVLTNSQLEQLKEYARTDTVFRKYVSIQIANSEKVLKAPLPIRVLVGTRFPNFLDTSRDCLRQIYTLSFAYRWTGDKRYSDCAKTWMNVMSNFLDWNPFHFLDVAEMTHAMAIGYDWLYSTFTQIEKKNFRDAIERNGLIPGLAAYNGAPYGWWTKMDHNWNQVCNSSLIIGSLAVADDLPEYAKIIIPDALRRLPDALAQFGPDGACVEGPEYWEYATNYTIFGISALESALGYDYDLSKVKGFSETGFFPIYTTGPTGLRLCYADCGEKSKISTSFSMFWLSQKFNQPFWAQQEYELIRKQGFLSLNHILYYVPEPPRRGIPLPLDKYFGGEVELATMRSSWNNPNALFIGIKGGNNQVNHGHLDLGNFEMDALGERWVSDLGSDSYDLSGYWEKESGERWKYFRTNSLSHNVPSIDGTIQNKDAKAHFIDWKLNGAEPTVKINLSEAYWPYCKKVTRTVKLLDNRQRILMSDEFTTDTVRTITWGMTTEAKVKLNGGLATLTMNGKTMQIRLLTKGAKFSILSAFQQSPQKNNTGYSRLQVQLKMPKGENRMELIFIPIKKGL